MAVLVVLGWRYVRRTSEGGPEIGDQQPFPDTSAWKADGCAGKYRW